MNRLFLFLLLLLVAAPTSAGPAPIWYWRAGDAYSTTAVTFTRAGLQAVLDLASPNRQLNVQIGPGNIDLDSTLWVHGNTSIHGSGKSTTTLTRSRFSGTEPPGAGHVVGTAPYGLHSRNASLRSGLPTDSLANIQIRDLTIDGNYTAWPTLNPNASGNMGVFAYYTDRFFLYNVEVKNTLQSGIELNGCKNSGLDWIWTQDTGKQLNLGSRNGINVNDYTSSLVTKQAGWGERITLSNISVRNQKDAAIDITNSSRVNVSNVRIYCDHDTTYGNYAFELEGSIAGYVRRDINIKNVVARGLTGAFFTNNAHLGDLDNVTIDGVDCVFSARAHQVAPIIPISGSSANKTTNFTIENGTFSNVGSADSLGTANAAWFIYCWNNRGPVSSRLRFINLTLSGPYPDLFHASTEGVRIGGKLQDILFRDVTIKNCLAEGFRIVAQSTDTLSGVTLENCRVEGSQNQSYLVQTAGGLVRDINILNCTAIDGMKKKGNAGCAVNVQTYAAGQSIRNVRIENLKMMRTDGAGTNMQGIEVIQAKGAAIDSVFLINNDVAGVSSNPYLIVGGPSHVHFSDPSTTKGTPAR